MGDSKLWVVNRGRHRFSELARRDWISSSGVPAAHDRWAQRYEGDENETRDLTPKTRKGIGMKPGQRFRSKVDVSLLTKLRQNREEADYDLWEPSSGEVKPYLERAEEFVDASARTSGDN